jgi:hypothetical protein
MWLIHGTNMKTMLNRFVVVICVREIFKRMSLSNKSWNYLNEDCNNNIEMIVSIL